MFNLKVTEAKKNLKRGESAVREQNSNMEVMGTCTRGSEEDR